MTKGLRDEDDRPLRCSGEVCGDNYFDYQCRRNATIMRGDKPYCGTHDPVRRAEKRKARDEAWDAARKQKEAFRAECKAGFVQRIIEIGQQSDTETRKQEAAALVDDIVSAGFNWWR